MSVKHSCGAVGSYETFNVGWSLDLKVLCKEVFLKDFLYILNVNLKFKKFNSGVAQIVSLKMGPAHMQAVLQGVIKDTIMWPGKAGSAKSQTDFLEQIRTARGLSGTSDQSRRELGIIWEENSA